MERIGEAWGRIGELGKYEEEEGRRLEVGM